MAGQDAVTPEAASKSRRALVEIGRAVREQLGESFRYVLVGGWIPFFHLHGGSLPPRPVAGGFYDEIVHQGSGDVDLAMNFSAVVGDSKFVSLLHALEYEPFTDLKGADRYRKVYLDNSEVLCDVLIPEEDRDQSQHPLAHHFPAAGVKVALARPVLMKIESDSEAGRISAEIPLASVPAILTMKGLVLDRRLYRTAKDAYDIAMLCLFGPNRESYPTAMFEAARIEGCREAVIEAAAQIRTLFRDGDAAGTRQAALSLITQGHLPSDDLAAARVQISSAVMRTIPDPEEIIRGSKG